MKLFDIFKRKSKSEQIDDYLIKLYFNNSRKALTTYANILKMKLMIEYDITLFEILILRCCGYSYFSRNEIFDSQKLLDILNLTCQNKLTSKQLLSIYENCFENIIHKRNYDQINNFDEWIKEAKSKVSHKQDVIICDTNTEFYDNLFDMLLSSGVFFYPNKEKENILFFVKNEKEYVNKDKQEQCEISGSMKIFPMLYLYAYLWLRNIFQKNPKLHSHLLSIMSDEKEFNSDEKIFYINQLLTNISLEELKTDNKAISELFYRLRAYNNIIKRLGGALGNFIDEHSKDKDFFVAQVNNDFRQTKEIEDYKPINIYAMDNIYIRDMLSGNKL